MIEALMIAPKGYKLHPMGNKCALAVDHIHECVYADENLETYADKELYVVIGYDDVCDNGNYEAILYGVYSTEQLAREAAEEGNIHHYEIECPKLDEFGWR